MKWNYSAGLLLLLAVSSVRADTVIFKNGDEIEGEILQRDEVTIKIAVEYGTMLVPLERVRRIDPDTPEKAAEREQKKAEAAALKERMEAEGKIFYKGKWVTEEAKKADEAKIAEAKKKREEAAKAAKKKAEEAAVAAKAAAEKLAADLAAAANDPNNQDTGRGGRFSRRHNRDDQNNNYNNGSSNYNNGSNYNNSNAYGQSAYGNSSYGGRNTNSYRGR